MNWIRPSCEWRRSTIFTFAMTFSRLTIELRTPFEFEDVVKLTVNPISDRKNASWRVEVNVGGS